MECSNHHVERNAEQNRCLVPFTLRARTPAQLCRFDALWRFQ
jgi:hypothetical protein